MLSAPVNSQIVRVQVVGITGGILVEFSTVEAAQAAVSHGILCRALGRSLVARPSNHPDQRGGLSFCTRCLGVGHRPHQCGERARCRECGQTGHCASNGLCPKGRRHPSKPKGSKMFCVCCLQEGHKAGAPSCTDLRQLRSRMSRGSDGTYTAAIEKERAARTQLSSTGSVSAAQPQTPTQLAPVQPTAGNVWFQRPPRSVAAEVQHSQITKLEQAMMVMQTQLATLVNSMSFLRSGFSAAQNVPVATDGVMDTSDATVGTGFSGSVRLTSPNPSC